MPACDRCKKFKPNLIKVSIKAGDFVVDRFDLCEADFAELRKLISTFLNECKEKKNEFSYVKQS